MDVIVRMRDYGQVLEREYPFAPYCQDKFFIGGNQVNKNTINSLVKRGLLSIGKVSPNMDRDYWVLTDAGKDIRE